MSLQAWLVGALLFALTGSGVIWLPARGDRPDERRSGPAVKTGLDVLLEKRLDLLRGKRIGIITNPTGITREGRFIVDLLYGAEGVEVKALFGPEHGFRGEANTRVPHGVDEKTGLPLYSLYGETNKPTPEMLQGLDALVFDIQDIGARFYTYTSTMSLAMEAAAEQGIEFIVLDRPNPITGAIVEGPLLKKEFASFVGLHPIPVRHGMTVGELARLINGEGWLAKGLRAKLTVVPLEHWERKLWFDETGLPWVKTSPNMTSLAAATLYPGICLLEALNVSEGRGTLHPFEYIGAPWVEPVKLRAKLNSYHLSAVAYEPITFTPEDIQGMTLNPEYEGQPCRGLKLTVTDRNAFRAVTLGIHLVAALQELYPKELAWSAKGFDRLMGTDAVRLALLRGEKPEKIVASWQEELKAFMKLREKYLLYQ